MAQWHYSIANERQGPVDENALIRMIATGVLTGSTLIWRSGMAQWVPVAQSELAHHLPPPLTAPDLSNPYAPPVVPLAVSAESAPIQRRDIAIVVLLSLATCGLYCFYLLYVWAQDINTLLGRREREPALIVVLSLVSCGIGLLACQCLFAFDLQREGERRSLPNRMSGIGPVVTTIVVASALVSLVGIPLSLIATPLAVGIIQSELNKFAAAAELAVART